MFACTKKQAFLDQFATEQPNNLSPEELSESRDRAVSTSFDALSAVVGQLDLSVKTASHGRLVRFLLEVSSTLSYPRIDANQMGKKIQDSADLMNAWSAVFPQVVEGCQGFSPAFRSGPISDQLTELRKSCSS